MERLTKLSKSGNKYVSAIGSGVGCWGEIIARLAAYEDTGLTPEEIETLQGRLNENIGAAKMWCRRYHELLQAYNEDRLLVLPCKVGDEVYLNIEGKTHKARVRGISVAAEPMGCVLHFGGWPVLNMWGSDFGKAVFLTREEAEAALATDNNVGHKPEEVTP